jgi:hypothetical protein
LKNSSINTQVNIMTRTFLWSSFCVVFLFTSLADAQQAPPASEILSRARQGRAELLGALGEMERFSPAAERKEEVYPYVLLLDELDEIGRGYDLESLGMNPVRKTGALVTRYAAKWIHFTNDDQELLRAFYKWAEDNTRFGTVDQQTVFVWRAKDVQELLAWNRRTIEIMEQIGEEKTISPYVLKGFDSLHADLAKKILAMREQLSEAEFLELATGATARPVIDEIAEHLHNAVLETTDVATLHQLLGWTMAFGKSIRSRDLVLPSYLEKRPGQTCLEAITKLAQQGRPAGVEAVDDIVDMLSGVQLVEATQMLSQLAESGFHGDSAEFLAALGRRLVRRTRDLGIARNRVEVEHAVSRLAMAEAINKYPPSGLYRWGPFSITVCTMSDTNLCVGITFDPSDNPLVAVDTALCRVLYDLETDEFVAYNYVVRNPYDELPIGPNAEMRFTVRESGGDSWLQGTLAMGTETYHISARRIRDFSLPISSNPPVTNYPGVYTGTMNGHPFQLTISRTNNMVIGWAIYRRERVRIDFPYVHFDRNRNAVYLTTVEFDPANVKHLRGIIDSRGNFKGLYIIGGTGQVLEVHLQKEKDQIHVQDVPMASIGNSGDAVRRPGDRG